MGRANCKSPKTLLIYQHTHLISELSCSRYAHAVRYVDKSDRLYVSGLRGLDILDPTSCEWTDTIHADDVGSGVSVPEVTEDRIYVMNGNGVVMALRHPSTST
jgi:hypothetical protein